MFAISLNIDLDKLKDTPDKEKSKKGKKGKKKNSGKARKKNTDT